MFSNTESYLANIATPNALEAVFRMSVTHNLAFAAWRLPNQEEFFACVSAQPVAVPEEFHLESAPAGFIMHPFTVTEENKAYFLEADLLFQGNFREDHLRFLSSSEKAISGNFFGKLQEALQQPEAPVNWHSAASHLFTANKSKYEELVKNAINFLKKGHAEKVVPSRCAEVALSPGFTPIIGFFNLLKKYPNAFVSLVSTAETGTWLGATPEILVVKDKQNIFRTVALAGTQKLAAGLNPADAIWRQKEIEEQSMVVRYVISCFKKIRLREYVETGPRTVAAGNLLHLRSDFCVPLNEEEFPNLTSRMLHLLHPTSAVCGQPKEAALEFLNAHENYNRRYYSGYLGPVNVQNETAIYVNLRCLELREKSAILFAGAGVTVDSDPTKEWQETELKMQTVSAALQLNTLLDDTATGY